MDYKLSNSLSERFIGILNLHRLLSLLQKIWSESPRYFIINALILIRTNLHNMRKVSFDFAALSQEFYLQFSKLLYFSFQVQISRIPFWHGRGNWEFITKWIREANCCFRFQLLAEEAPIEGLIPNYVWNETKPKSWNIDSKSSHIEFFSRIFDLVHKAERRKF